MAKKNETDAVKLAKLERDTQRERLLVSSVTAIITNPVVAGILGFWLVDRLGGAYVEQVDQETFAQQQGYHYTGGTIPPGGLPIKKVWSPTAGIMSRGSQIAAQAGLTGYLGAEAIKSIGSTVSSVVDIFTP